MIVQNFYKNYFNGVEECLNWKNNTLQNRIINLIKVLSYFTIIVPISIGLAKGVSLLVGRVKHLTTSTEKDLFLSKKVLADNGNAEAQFDLALFYFKKENGLEGLKYLNLAVEQNHLEALCYLGDLYLKNSYVKQDFKKARELFQLAARFGSSLAFNHLGYIYLQGIGVQENSSLAFKYYQQSANNRNAFGQAMLGWMYEEGEGVEEDVDLAIELFQLSANQKCSLGQLFLGCMYWKGEGVEKNIVEAKKYLTLAARQGETKAEEFLLELNKI